MCSFSFRSRHIQEMKLKLSKCNLFSSSEIMDTSMLRRSHSVEEEAELQKDSDSDDGILSKIISSTEKVRDLKLKDLPLVHQTKKKSEK